MTLRPFSKDRKSRAVQSQTLVTEAWIQLPVTGSDLRETTEPQLTFILHLKMEIIVFLYLKTLMGMLMVVP